MNCRLFEEEINKFLFPELRSGMIPLMLATIRVKKHIDFMSSHIKKEDFVNIKLTEFVKLSIEDQREKILLSLDMNNNFIMNMTICLREFEKDDFIVEPYLYRSRKNIMRMYKANSES